VNTSISFNIGLNVGPLLTHCEADIHNALLATFPNSPIIASYVRRSGIGELTCCVTISCADLLARDRHDAIYALALLLRQDAIAAKHNGTNLLIGPKASDWNNGEFNEDYWLSVVPDNRPNPDGLAVAATLGATTHSTADWAVSFYRQHGSTLDGWFERNSDGEGGGLWLALDNGPDNTLQLIDYDGVTCLPAAVLTLLRQAGVDADSTFE